MVGAMSVECIQWRDLTSHWFETYLIDTDTWNEAYTLGYRAPNYPVPATMFNSALANYHNPKWSWVWAVQWVKARYRL